MTPNDIVLSVYTAAHALLSGAKITDEEEKLIQSFYAVLKDRFTEEDWAILGKIIRG